MDRLDLVRRQDLDRPEWVGQPPPGELLQTGRGTPGPPTRAVIRLKRSVFRFVHERMLRPGVVADVTSCVAPWVKDRPTGPRAALPVAGVRPWRRDPPDGPPLTTSRGPRVSTSGAH